MLTFLNGKGLDLESLWNSWDESAHIWEAKESWSIEMDMPGVPKDKIDLKVRGRTLDVRGERTRLNGQTQVLERSFHLPETIRSTDGITATTENGVLTIKVPKRSLENVYQIPVN